MGTPRALCGSSFPIHYRKSRPPWPGPLVPEDARLYRCTHVRPQKVSVGGGILFRALQLAGNGRGALPRATFLLTRSVPFLEFNILVFFTASRVDLNFPLYF